MRPIVSCTYLFLVASTACSNARTPETGVPMPLPPQPVPTLSTKGPWSFNYAPGTVAYWIVRSAAIESQSDPDAHKEIATNATHESLTLQVAGDTIHFTAAVDTFSTTTQGLIGPVQGVMLPGELTGSLVGDSRRPTATLRKA